MGQIYRAKGTMPPQTQQHHAQGGQYAAQGQQAGGSFHGFTSFPLYYNIGAGGAATEKNGGGVLKAGASLRKIFPAAQKRRRDSRAGRLPCLAEFNADETGGCGAK